jgi:predicted alpha/beta-fold hydrolase
MALGSGEIALLLMGTSLGVAMLTAFCGYANHRVVVSNAQRTQYSTLQ